jgi:hypothetical protein
MQLLLQPPPHIGVELIEGALAPSSTISFATIHGGRRRTEEAGKGVAKPRSEEPTGDVSEGGEVGGNEISTHFGIETNKYEFSQ